MPMDTTFSKSLIAAALAAAYPTFSQAQAVARIDFAAGNVTALGTDGRSRPLGKGGELQVGETVDTREGRAQMRFRDGALVSLQPQTQFRVDNFVFDNRGSQNESAVMSLLKGGLRTITGLVGRTNREGYKLQTATATVGIRGTEFSVAYDAGGSVTMFVAGGAIDVTNQTGTVVVPGGKSVNVGGQNQTPQTSDEKPFLPPAGTNVQVAGPANPIQDANPPNVVQLLTGTVENASLAYIFPGASRGTISGVATSTLNAAGALIAAGDIGFEGPLAVGGATAVSKGNDGIIAWGQWTGGKFLQRSNQIDAGTSDGPFNYIVGLPATNLPTTGNAEYNMLSPTSWTASCTFFCGDTGITSSKLLVEFGSGTSKFQLGGRFVGNAFDVTAPMMRSGSILNVTGTRVPGFDGLTLYGAGFLAGSDGSRAGMAYKLYEGSLDRSVNGVIAYKQGATNVVAPLQGEYSSLPMAYSYTGRYPNDGTASSVVLNGAGALSSASTINFEGPISVGAATPVSAGNNGVIAWGRWIGGLTGQGQDLAANGPLHYIVGLPVTNMPTSGTAEYNLIGATASCNFACGDTAVTSSRLVVSFGSGTGSFELGMKIGGAPMSAVTPLNGGYAGNSMLSASGQMSAPGQSGSPSYNVNASGFLAGNAASHAGMAYRVQSIANSSSLVNGVLAYSKGALNVPVVGGPI